MIAREFTHKDHHGVWTYASRNESPGDLVVNAVVIVAKVDEQVLVTDEFRVPLARREYGFPAGLCEPGESRVAAAVRELREESGLYATGVYTEATTPPLVSSAGLSDECVEMVFAEAEGEISHDLCEPSESIHAELMDVEQISDLIFNRSLVISGKAWGIMWGWWMMGKVYLVPPGDERDRLKKVTWEDRGIPGKERFTIQD
jgi:ADP-ribose pyrophosphatase